MSLPAVAGRIQRLACLVIVAALAGVASAQQPSTTIAPGSPVPYREFRQAVFQPLVTVITTQLTPCGCALNRPPPTFTFEGVTPPYVNYQMLNTGTERLLTYMHDLMVKCQCVEGAAVVESARSLTQEPSSQANIDQGSAAIFQTRIDNVIGQVLLKCCDPQQSSRNYQFIVGSFSFAEAADDARRRGGTVASVLSRPDCMKATNVLRSVGATSNPVSTPSGLQPFAWIGLREQSGIRSWLDGSPESFTNWGHQQPEADKGCTGFCLSESATIFSTWNTLDCDPVRLPYLLELPPVEVAEKGDDTTVIIIVIGVLAAIFVAAIVFIAMKRFVPACREDGRRGRRVNREDVEDRNARHARTHRRTRRARRGDADDDVEAVEMTGEGDTGLGSAHPASARRRRRRVLFPAQGDDGADADGTAAPAPEGRSRRTRRTTSPGRAQQAPEAPRAQAPSRNPPVAVPRAVAAAGGARAPPTATRAAPRATARPTASAVSIPGSPGHGAAVSPQPVAPRDVHSPVEEVGMGDPEGSLLESTLDGAGVARMLSNSLMSARSGPVSDDGGNADDTVSLGNDDTPTADVVAPTAAQRIAAQRPVSRAPAPRFVDPALDIDGTSTAMATEELTPSTAPSEQFGPK